MPRISVEKKIPIKNNIFEIKTMTYELPENIVYKGKYLSYDNYHIEYTDRKDFSISVLDYLKIVLNSSNNQNNDEDDFELEK